MIFLPDRKMTRTFIRAVLKKPADESDFMFCLKCGLLAEQEGQFASPM
jgi:hypothetical protein